MGRLHVTLQDSLTNLFAISIKCKVLPQNDKIDHPKTLWAAPPNFDVSLCDANVAPAVFLYLLVLLLGFYVHGLCGLGGISRLTRMGRVHRVAHNVDVLHVDCVPVWGRCGLSCQMRALVSCFSVCILDFRVSLCGVHGRGVRTVERMEMLPLYSRCFGLYVGLFRLVF
jgi:hypothetical protein